MIVQAAEAGSLERAAGQGTRRETELLSRTEDARGVVWDAATRVKLGGVLIGLMIGHTFIRNKHKDLKYAVEHDYLHNIDKTVLGILRADDAVRSLRGLVLWPPVAPCGPLWPPVAPRGPCLDYAWYWLF